MITLQNREGIQYGISVQLVTHQCITCSVPFAFPVELDNYLQRTKESFYCPAGHSQHYSKSTEVILKEKLEQEKISREREKEYYKEKIEQERKSHSATKAQLTRVKNRVANGVCPCCNRSFENLHEHIKKQHPEFKPDKNN